MEGARLKKALDAALGDLAETERRIRALCEEYWRTEVPWVTLYWQDRGRGGAIQGPFWGRVRRIGKAGKRRVVKDYLGTRLTKVKMLKLGVADHALVLQDFDRRAGILRTRRNKLTGALHRIGKLLAKYAE